MPKSVKWTIGELLKHFNNSKFDRLFLSKMDGEYVFSNGVFVTFVEEQDYPALYSKLEKYKPPMLIQDVDTYIANKSGCFENVDDSVMVDIIEGILSSETRKANPTEFTYSGSRLITTDSGKIMLVNDLLHNAFMQRDNVMTFSTEGRHNPCVCYKQQDKVIGIINPLTGLNSDLRSDLQQIMAML